MKGLDRLTVRVIAAHGIAAVAVALPWPLLLVLVDDHGHDPMLVGLVGAARMLPYVALSWVTARLADAIRRDLIVRGTLVARTALLLVSTLGMVTGQVWVAVVACTLAVAVATPAYPAQVAAMPGIAGSQRRRATDVLVTVEVAAFVVGAAFGGLLLNPATRELLPWFPAAMTGLALLLVLPVSMPAPSRVPGKSRASATQALRRAPEAWRAIAVMASVNLVIALVAVALLPLARDSWSSDAAGYGVATGVLGCAAFGAPLLRRLGRSPEASTVWGLCLMAAGLLLVVPAPSLGWSLAPLALAGAAAVSVEASATAVLQEHVLDEVRATVLGINDSVVIAAALVGSLVAALAVALLGATSLLGGLAAGVVAVAWWSRPHGDSDDQERVDQERATVGGTRLEAHEPASSRAVAPADRIARRTAVRGERLLPVERRQGTGVVLPRQQGERTLEPAEVRRTR